MENRNALIVVAELTLATGERLRLRVQSPNVRACVAAQASLPARRTRPALNSTFVGGAIRVGVVDVGRRLAYSIFRAASWFRPDAITRAPWERSVLDDIAIRRPWNLLVKAARLQGLIRTRSLRNGVTIVIVNWNTLPITADVIAAIEHYGPSHARILVVDNGSTDGSRQWLKSRAGIDTVLLPGNAGHGVALDLAISLVRTKITVTLDSDAIPLASNWLTTILTPMEEPGVRLVGVRSSRGFVHPMFAAVDTQNFVRDRLSFQVHRQPGSKSQSDEWGVNAWDTGELLTRRLGPTQVRFLERTPNPVDGLRGMVASGVVYHHGGVSRSSDGEVSPEGIQDWRTACRRLGLSFLDYE